MSCCICLESKITHAFIPCGHAACCTDCTREIMDKKSKCPCCRSIINDKMHIYIVSETFDLRYDLILLRQEKSKQLDEIKKANQELANLEKYIRDAKKFQYVSKKNRFLLEINLDNQKKINSLSHRDAELESIVTSQDINNDTLWVLSDKCKPARGNTTIVVYEYDRLIWKKIEHKYNTVYPTPPCAIFILMKVINRNSNKVRLIPV